MIVTPLAIADVVLVTPRRFADDRGWFEETWNRRTLEGAGLRLDFVQDNQSLSRQEGTIRGLHLQVAPHSQAKLIRVLIGAILDVAVDLREGSPTYGRWVSAKLSAENGRQLLVPRGFAHGFRTLAPDTAVAYKADGVYDRGSERGIRFDDPDLRVDWGPPANFRLSAKDRELPRLRDVGSLAF